MIGVCNAQGAGPTGQISLNFNCKANFKDFLTKLCVSSQMKDIKHIRQDFHLVAWVMSKWWDLEVIWGLGGQKHFFPKFNPIWCVSFLHEWHMQRHMFFLKNPHPLGSWGGAERSNIIKSQLQSQFRRF